MLQRGEVGDHIGARLRIGQDACHRCPGTLALGLTRNSSRVFSAPDHTVLLHVLAGHRRLFVVPVLRPTTPTRWVPTFELSSLGHAMTGLAAPRPVPCCRPARTHWGVQRVGAALPLGSRLAVQTRFRPYRRAGLHNASGRCCASAARAGVRPGRSGSAFPPSALEHVGAEVRGKTEALGNDSGILLFGPAGSRTPSRRCAGHPGL